MTDEQPQGGPESGRESPTIKPGHLLREARERKRLSLQAVAEHLNLRAQVVEYLEQDRYERLPPLTFVKGYLRAYAKLVEEPEDRVMAAFAQLGLEAEAREPELPRGQPRGAGARWLPALLLLAVVLVAALFWLRGEQGLPWQDEGAPGAQETPAVDGGAGDGQADMARATPADEALSDEREPTRRALTGPAAAEGGVQRAEEQPAGEATPSDSLARDQEKAAAPVQTAPEESIQPPARSPRPGPDAAPAQAETAPVEPATDSEPDQASAEIEPAAESEAQTQLEPAAEPEPSAEVLVIRVRGNAWMDVRDGGGERVLYGTVQGPELFRFDGPYPYQLTIGDASAVELEFRGEPVDLAPHTRGRVARLSLPEQR